MPYTARRTFVRLVMVPRITVSFLSFLARLRSSSQYGLAKRRWCGSPLGAGLAGAGGAALGVSALGLAGSPAPLAGASGPGLAGSAAPLAGASGAALASAGVLAA